MRTGPLPAFNEGRSASHPAATFLNLSRLLPAWSLPPWGASGPVAPKVMRYLGDRLRHGERAGRRPCLIQIVHAPPSGVPLRPAMFRSFRCADCLHPLPPGYRQVSANFRPELWPAVEGGGKERKSGFRHVPMLGRKILSNDRELPCQPALENGPSL